MQRFLVLCSSQMFSISSDHLRYHIEFFVLLTEACFCLYLTHLNPVLSCAIILKVGEQQVTGTALLEAYLHPPEGNLE